MRYRRMPIEAESPEEYGYDRIRCNLAESSVADASLAMLGTDLGDLLLQYGDHRGLPALREHIAADAPGLEADDVLVTAGAAGALFLIATTLLQEGDHLVVVRPNYATNIETPRAIGAEIAFVDLVFEEGWRIDPARLAAAVTDRTRLVSITVPHNPTGRGMPEADLRAIVADCERRGVHLLVDETYREMTFGGPLPIAASLSERAISVSSLSKTYGLPGIRTGWLACRDRDLVERLLAAKEQVSITGSVVDETIALRARRMRDAWLPGIMAGIAEGFAITRDWVAADDLVEWVEPDGGVVCFPRIRPEADVDVALFHRVLVDDLATVVGPGHWFERPDTYMRIGYGWPARDRLVEGLGNVSAAIRRALR
ncbi:MAG: pyridoxal phosphate-dependent aminotransferase [Chloroflexi bacterium]|jgi:aspartate/methionine/tyrosine aminotransferase|nr:pyridoxal phosphate-dependent aminotransferase [Chloroflexota bacterium]